MRRSFSAFACAAAVLFAIAPGASAQALECGAVVTASVTLTAPLTGCESDGLVVGADGVTVDLNGYAIEGVGRSTSGVGVAVSDRAGVTVKNGVIRGFGQGVRVWNSDYSLITNLAIDNVGGGVAVLGDPASFGGPSQSNRVIGNTISDSGYGIRAQYSPWFYAEGNVVSQLGEGINVWDSPASSLVRNTASGNAFNGIVLFRSGATNISRFERNTANGNGGNGIDSSDTHGIYLNNVTNSNAGTGLFLWDGSEEHGPGFTVAGNVANTNGIFGIWTKMIGVINGGKNRAHANAVEDCVRITCN